MPKKDARTLVARFNEQIEPIYALLRETEDVNLAYEILEPEPTEIPALKQRWEWALVSLTAVLPHTMFLCSVRFSQTFCNLWLHQDLTCSAPRVQMSDKFTKECVVYKEIKGHNHFFTKPGRLLFFWSVICMQFSLVWYMNHLLLPLLVYIPTPCPSI